MQFYLGIDEGEIEREDLEGEISEELVYKCLKIKQRIVEQDEKESEEDEKIKKHIAETLYS